MNRELRLGAVHVCGANEHGLGMKTKAIVTAAVQSLRNGTVDQLVFQRGSTFSGDIDHHIGDDAAEYARRHVPDLEDRIIVVDNGLPSTTENEIAAQKGYAEDHNATITHAFLSGPHTRTAKGRYIRQGMGDVILVPYESVLKDKRHFEPLIEKIDRSWYQKSHHLYEIAKQTITASPLNSLIQSRVREIRGSSNAVMTNPYLDFFFPQEILKGDVNIVTLWEHEKSVKKFIPAVFRELKSL
jgi:hypothetical protein